MDPNIETFIGCDSSFEKARIVLFGAPFDSTTSFRPGARFGPSAMRHESFGLETYSPYQDKDLTDYRIFDSGDLELCFGSAELALLDIESRAEEILAAGKLPVLLGGEHLVTLGSFRAIQRRWPDVHIIHFDAHLDWTRSIGGQTRSNGSPMRNCAALPYVGRIIHLGIRGIGSSGPADFADARANGDQIHSVKETRALGIERILEDLTPGGRVYLTFDIDGMDAACAPATGSPMFGGFLYDEVVEMFEAIAKHSQVIGMDMVEVAPPYDDAGDTTAYLAARLVSDLLGFVTKERERAEQ